VVADRDAVTGRCVLVRIRVGIGVGRRSARGRADTMFTVPFTRGSTTKLRPVISPTAFTTASMSALTKLSVTMSASWAEAAAPVPIQARRNSVRNHARQRRAIQPVAQWPASAGHGGRMQDETTAIDGKVRRSGSPVSWQQEKEWAPRSRIGGDDSMGCCASRAGKWAVRA
jgi:hypothetical protein